MLDIKPDGVPLGLESFDEGAVTTLGQQRFRVLREADDASSPTSAGQFTMNFLLHHVGDDIVNLGAADSKLLQVLLGHTYVVP